MKQLLFAISLISIGTHASTTRTTAIAQLCTHKLWRNTHFQDIAAKQFIFNKLIKPKDRISHGAQTQEETQQAAIINSTLLDQDHTLRPTVKFCNPRKVSPSFLYAIYPHTIFINKDIKHMLAVPDLGLAFKYIGSHAAVLYNNGYPYSVFTLQYITHQDLYNKMLREFQARVSKPQAACLTAQLTHIAESVETYGITRHDYIEHTMREHRNLFGSIAQVQ